VIRMIEITDFHAPELDIFARKTEAQLLNKDHPEEGMFIAESPKVIERALNAGYTPVAVLVEKKQIEGEAASVLARCDEIPVYTAEFDVLAQLTGFKLTRGMLCAMRRRGLPEVEKVCQNAKKVAVLENVMNPTNVGAIFRSAAALNMDAVLLTGGCSNHCIAEQAVSVWGRCFRFHGHLSEKSRKTGLKMESEDYMAWDFRLRLLL
jgi:tRNA G18 (ribose-2'-O)-methylase SpoU